MKNIHKRRWLEPSCPHTHSYVSYSVQRDGAVDLTVADCNRKVNLYFPSDSKGKRKLGKLIETLREAQDHMLSRSQ